MNPGTQATQKQRWTVVAGLLLILVTLALYWPATSFDSVQIDDGQYVFENPHVVHGISWTGVKWAFTSFHAANWHPLTWISHMLDCSLFGSFMGGHHLTNILLHTLNTLLLFLVLQRMTKRAWPSWVVAALFGWHPLHVESVAWIAERKDVLSTLFLMLTLGAYSSYVELSKGQSPKLRLWYFAALGFFAAGLMSKPMLVTLPCVMLLLDYWPLRRLGDASVENAVPAISRTWLKLIVEKLPFIFLATAACAVTLIAQRAGGAVRTVADVPYGLRLCNALIACAQYLGKAVWLANLSIYYLLPAKIAAGSATGAGLLLAGISYAAWRVRRCWPWMPVGWLWFLGTLVPVIGFVQVGSQALADRYTYIPLIGLFIAAVWSADKALENARAPRILAGGLVVVTLAACLALTRRQLAYWHDNVALFQHAVTVTPDNYFAEYELATAYSDASQTTNGIEHFETCLRLNPGYEPAHYRLGIELAGIGKLDEASFHFSEALKRDPDSEVLHNNLGTVLAQQGRSADAIAEFMRAMQINPNYAKPYLNYGNILQRGGEFRVALLNYEHARELDPASPETLDKLALLLATCPDATLRDPTAAVKWAENANDLTRQHNPVYLTTLATAYAAATNFPKAITTAESALARTREFKLPELAAKLESDLASYRLGQMPPTDESPLRSK